ncbi:MAG: sugar ABC transporter permease, partial [Lachnospiraceae bacterium]|nr:sugar ABC transporter permease [Lachnospiraceae bacterium]
DLVKTLTDGRPAGETQVMMTYIYAQFFDSSGSMDYGRGSAYVVITAMILGVVTIIYLRTTKKAGNVYS